MNEKSPFDCLKGIGSSIAYIIRISCRYDKSYLVLFIPHILITSVSPFILILFSKWIIDSLILGVSFSRTLLLVTGMFLARIILTLVDSHLQQACLIRQITIKNQMKMDILNHMLSIPYVTLENPQILDLKGRAEQCVDGEYDIARIANTVSNFISSILTLLGLITLVSQLNLWIFPLILFIVILNSAANSKQASKSHFFCKQFSSIARKLFYIIGLTWDNKYAKEIRTYSLKEWLSQKKQHYLEETSKRSIRIFMLSTLTGLLSNSTMAIQQGLIYLYLAYRVFCKTLTIGDFSMYLTGVSNFSGCLSNIMNTYVELKEISLYVQDLQSFMRLAAEDSPHIVKAMKKSIPHMIEFQNVSFRYPNQAEDAVHNLSFRIKQGEKLSIVGENGAGKTTVIKLLLRLYQPDQGSILLDDIDISAIPFESYTKLFSVVFQDYKALAFSVAENIGYGNIENEKLWASIKKVGLEQKLSLLEQKEKTYMSRQYDEHGIEFSGGEQQKVAIASALYKDAPIMIMDEPTANLSPLAEYELYQQFHSITENKTVIYISHRMSSCRFCDNILVLDHGERIEYGTHNMLMKNKENYYNMFQIQAQYYLNNC